MADCGSDVSWFFRSSGWCCVLKVKRYKGLLAVSGVGGRWCESASRLEKRYEEARKGHCVAQYVVKSGGDVAC